MDLPPIARRPFTEVDGTIGRVVLVYPVETGLSVWNGRDLLRIASVLQYLHLPNGKVLETSGSAVVFGAMIRSILHDGPIATAASLIAVLIIVAFTIRPARVALMALATLALGVLWMVGGAGWGHVRVTFLNFIALPITFGIGAEYAINVRHALPRGPQHRARRALDRRGGGALLVDHDRRLRLAAGGAQPGAERLRLDGDPGRGRLPDGGDHRAAGGAALVAQARGERTGIRRLGDRVARSTA